MSLLLRLNEYTEDANSMNSSDITLSNNYDLQKKYFIPNTTKIKKERYNRTKTLKRKILGKWMKQKYNSF